MSVIFKDQAEVAVIAPNVLFTGHSDLKTCRPVTKSH